MRALRIAALVAACSALHAPAPVAAQDGMPERRMGVTWRDGRPTVHFSAVDLADASVQEALQGGLPQTLVLRIVAQRPGGEIVAATARVCEVRYDVWTEDYHVAIDDPGRHRVASLRSMDAVLRSCLVADRIPVGTSADFASLHHQRVRFIVTVELNPISPETLQRLRRWLSRPAGGGRAGGQAFFGSFVSLFVNRSIGSAERTLRFRSRRREVP